MSLIGAALECYPDLLDVLWEKLANDMAPSHLDTIITQEVTLQNLPECFDAYIDSAITGRTLVKIK